MGREYYVYILSNKTRTMVYVGVTADLERRYEEHLNHIFPNSFTARYDVTTLVYYETFDHVDDAIAREKQIKSWKRWRKNRLVESLNPRWVDLTREEP